MFYDTMSRLSLAQAVLLVVSSLAIGSLMTFAMHKWLDDENGCDGQCGLACPCGEAYQFTINDEPFCSFECFTKYTEEK